MPHVSAQELREVEAALEELPRRIAEGVVPIIKMAVAAEREACANVAASHGYELGATVAEAIRRRNIQK